MMAMGQEGHRAIHPFFRKEIGTSTDNLPPTAAEHGLPKDSNHDSLAPETPYTVTKQTDEPSRMSSVHSHELSPFQSAAPVEESLEHDPNTGRRKRRKTEKHSKEAPTHGSITKYITSQRDSSQEPEPLQPVVRVSGAELQATPTPDLPFTAPSTDPRTELESAKRTPTPAKDTPVNIDSTGEEKRSPKRKTIKLNSNGKLLSSPVSKPQTDDDTKKRSEKRRKSERRVIDTKVVVFRYPKTEEVSLGKLIDDILNGKRRHAPTKPSKPAPPPVKKDEPPKPTHPFFMKKPARKPDACPSPVSQDAQTTKTASSTPNRQSPSGSPMRSFSSFKHRPSKIPDPIYPVWPPRDFCHVRGLDDNAALLKGAVEHPLGLGPKKSKMAAVSVSDKESVLSPDLQSMTCEPAQVLRLPGRNTSSGYVLQKAVTRQLSHNTLSSTRKDALSNVCHPAIAQLHSSIPSTMSAFDTGNFDSLLWAQKYAPSSVEQVLQATKEVQMLQDWLKFLTISAVDTGKPSKDGQKKQTGADKKKKKRKKSDKLDGFVVSSSDEDYQMDEVSDSDEDELAGGVTVSSKRTVIRASDLTLSSRTGAERSRISNAILISGPPGCGKTASIYAVAKELDFEVFEINPGSRRSARDIVERVGDMTRNHLVHNFDERGSRQDRSSSTPGAGDEKQNKLMGFFKSAGSKDTKKAGPCKDKEPEKESDPTRTRQQKQSFILLEEADILFEEDRQFWSGVLTLINQSKRPIIITCNDESRIPLNDISFHAILRFRPPPQHLAVDYLLLLAAKEGHLLKREALNALYMGTGKDLRRSITDLNFWCQMAVGSEKSGLDWIIDRWPRGCDLDEEGNPQRVISLNTYEQFMGWFSRDMLLCGTLDSEVEPGQESLMWWQLSLQDGEDMSDVPGLAKDRSNASREQRLEDLRRFSDLMDSRSTLDILSADLSLDPSQDVLDTSIESISEKQRASYIEGYPLLTAEPLPCYTSLPAAIGNTYATFLRRVFRPRQQKNIEKTQAVKSLAKITQPKPPGPSHSDLLHALEPVMKPNYVFPPPIGRVSLSFENGLAPISEDLAPYIRAIMGYDLRLEQYRLHLSGLLSHDTQGTKRVRTTRASRAALEGGNKAETRKERWLPPDTNASLILGTGKREWQEALVQAGYFNVSMGEGGASSQETVGESSSDGGI